MRPFLFLLIAAPLFAQFDPFISKNIPLLPDGKPDLKADTPKMPDGKPDLNGVWWVVSKFAENDQSDERRAAGPQPYGNIAAPQPPNSLPMRPEARQLLSERMAGQCKDLPLSKCLPTGVPLGYLLPVPNKFVQPRTSWSSYLKRQTRTVRFISMGDLSRKIPSPRGWVTPSVTGKARPSSLNRPASTTRLG